MNTLVFTLFGVILTQKSLVPEGFNFIGNHIKIFSVHVFHVQNKVTSFWGVIQCWIPLWLAFISGGIIYLKVNGNK